MKNQNLLYFIVIIVLVALNNNCYEYLTNNKLKAPQILFYRGGFTLLLTIVYARYKKQTLVPTDIKAQALRFITTGGSLLLALFSFNYLSAGTVSLLSRLDIPVLVLFSVLLKKSKHWFQIALSLLVIGAVLFLTIDPNFIDEDRNGFLLIFGSIGMVAIGYLTVHRGSNTESIPALINVSSMSCLFFGGLLMIFYRYEWVIAFENVAMIIISSFINIALFYLTIARYKAYSPEKALLPFVLAILSTSVFEMIIEQKFYSAKELIVTATLTFIISLICLINPTKTTIINTAS